MKKLVSRISYSNSLSKSSSLGSTPYSVTFTNAGLVSSGFPTKNVIILLMAEILHQLRFPLFLGFQHHPRWCRISAINSTGGTSNSSSFFTAHSKLLRSVVEVRCSEPRCQNPPICGFSWRFCNYTNRGHYMTRNQTFGIS